MPKSYRLLALVLLLASGGSMVTFATAVRVPSEEHVAAPGILPAAFANPVDISYEDTLHAGETIGELLRRVELAEDDARALLVQLEQHQDPRRMRPGSVVAFRRAIDDGVVRKMELRLDADRTLNLLRAGEEWVGAIEEVPVTPDTVVLTGVVETSLYRAMLEGDNGDVPAEERERVVDLLADRIFAWQIDFSRDLREGDQFRVLYERLVRPDGTARTGRVLGVQFTINRRDYEAYAFTARDVDDYFDRNGESLRRAFLRAPLQYRRISSVFSNNRMHPVLKTNRPHNGIDYAAASGTPVYAVGDGVIKRAGNGGSYGNVIDISHIRGYSSRYAHLRGFAPGIRAGVRVKQGDLIGYVGATGLATGPHLHYEFHTGGRPVDPNSVQGVTGDPVPASLKGDFLAQIDEHIGSLDVSSRPVLFADLSRGASLAGD